MSKVSILVAAFNAAPFLEKCLASLVGQTHADLEILCVDDASTDDTPAILDRWALRDTRVQVTHLAENGGQAHARNVGLQKATGQFVCMVDSDDWLSPDALEKAVATFHDEGFKRKEDPVLHSDVDRVDGSGPPDQGRI